MSKLLKLFLVVTVIFAFQSIHAQYKPGTYTGTAIGRSDKKHSGEIEVAVTVSESKIEKIEVTKYDQSVDHKKYGEGVTKAKETIPAAIVKQNNLGVDAVTDATMSSTGIELAVARALMQAHDGTYKPGTYTGTAIGRSDKKHSGEIEVSVTVSESKIEKIEVTKYDQSVDHKKYGESVNKAKESVPAAILAKNGLGVDVVTDATMSSTGIELAVARALLKAF